MTNLRNKLDAESAKPGKNPNTVNFLRVVFSGGELLRWPEFWDYFDSGAHSNESLSPVENMNYLRFELILKEKL